MKILKKFKKFVHKYMNGEYLIKYKVTNYKVKKEGEMPISEWDSKIYDYIISAESAESAKRSFTDIFSKEVSGFRPSPKLTIISCKELDEKEIKNGKGSFKNEIKFY